MTRCCLCKTHQIHESVMTVEGIACADHFRKTVYHSALMAFLLNAPVSIMRLDPALVGGGRSNILTG